MKTALRLLLSGWFVAAALRAAAPAPAETPAEGLRMSPYEVSANSVEFRHWVKVSSPHFVVYSDASERDLKKLVHDAEMLRFAEELFLGRRTQSSPPLVMVLPTASSDWRKLEVKGEVQWAVVGISLGGAVRQMVVSEYDWQIDGPYLIWSQISATQMALMGLRGPQWFERGMGHYFETADIHDAQVSFGRPNPRIVGTRGSKWIPWGRFFVVDGRSPEFTTSSGIELYDGQSALLLHYLLNEQDAAWQTRLMEWVEFQGSGHAPDEANFTRIFGEDWKAWDTRLSNYVHGTRYTAAQITVPPSQLEFDVEVTVPPVAEIRELFVLAQILLQRVPASEASLDVLLAKGLKSDGLRELLAEACLQWHRPRPARKELDQLMAAGSTNPGVWATAATLRRGKVVDNDGAEEETFFDAPAGRDLTEARRLYERAIALEPAHRLANLGLASTIASAPKVTADDCQAILKLYNTLKGYESCSELLAALATAEWRAGHTARATMIVQKLLTSPIASEPARRTAQGLVQKMHPTEPNPSDATLPAFGDFKGSILKQP